MGGTKRVTDNPTYIVDGDMSEDILGERTDILHVDRVGFHMSWTGTPTGNFTVEITNIDPKDGNTADVKEVELTLSVVVAAAGSAAGRRPRPR